MDSQATIVRSHSMFDLFNMNTLRDLEKEIEEQTEESVLDDSERYNVFIAVEINGDIRLMNLMSKIKLSERDEELLKEWIREPNQPYYMKEKFRVILENFILIVNIYRYERTNNNMVLYGFAVNNTSWDKMTLQIQRQKNINLSIGLKE